MPIGITDDHVELAASISKWAFALDPVAEVRAAEADPSARFEKTWAAVSELGLPVIAVPSSAGGGDGSLLDLTVALEACARAMVPGPLLTTAAAASALMDHDLVPRIAAGEVTVGFRPPGSEVIWDGTSVSHVLLEDSGAWYVAPATGVTPGYPPDLSRRAGSLVGLPPDAVEVEGLTTKRMHLLLPTLAAAEASGVARWCLDTAVEYAKVREQFGKPIGAFQAVKHLCAEMLELSESITVAAWDAARAYDESQEQWEFAANVAGSVAFDGAVDVAKSCIQVLGGIGFTFEHDVHFYLRRAIALRAMCGSASSYDGRLLDLATRGLRRRSRIDFAGRDTGVRDRVRADVRQIAELPKNQHRAALAEARLLAPHWPEPYGLAADPVHQLVIDEELSAAGVDPPDLKIGGWAAPTVLAHGTDEQRGRFVPPTLTGELQWCQLFSEPGAGSDLASLRTKAVRSDEDGRSGWRLTGQKVWTSLAREADWGICLARTNPDAKPHHAITYFLVDMNSPGIEIRPLREMTGDAMFNEVFLDDVFVPDDCVVGEVDGGWKLARTTLTNERVAMAGSQLGRSVDAALTLVGDDPVAKVRVGRAVAQATVVSLLGIRTTLRSISGQGPGPESSVAKLVGVRSRQDSAELVVELLGDRIALDDERARAAVHQQLLTRCLSIAGGTTQVLRNVAAERILGLPRG
ncbi:MAG: acyl-CoA dehydrogenase [Actinomycetota bacterium]|nr:acyl-CoA dehydrogenase [Actinomycetota bacterium]